MNRHDGAKRPAASCFVAALAFSTCAAASAEELPASPVEAYDITEIVVTASRRAEKAFDLPYYVNSQDMMQLQERRQVRTIPDAMREMPSVMVQKTGHGQGSPYIRGFTGLRTLFLVDGIRLNNSTFREGPNQYWNTVDSFSVQRLELVKGPSSVLYGSDAIGGTVNAISRSLDNYEAASGFVNRVALRGSSAEGSYVMRPEFGYSGSSTDIYGGFSLKRFGDLRAGAATGTQPKTGYDEYDADLKLSMDLDNGHNLVAAIQHVDLDDAWRVHKTVFAKSWRGTTTGNELERSLDQRRTLSYLQYRANDLVLSLSYHDQDESRFRLRSDGRTDRQGTDVGTLGVWGQYSFSSISGVWTLGAEFYEDDVDSYRSDFNADGTLRRSAIQGPVADDATYRTSSVFAQNQVAMGARSELVTGLRLTRSDANARAVQDPVTGDRIRINDSWTDLTGSIRLSRRLGDGADTRIFAGISQGFRAPNLSDLTRFDTARSNEIETPVTGLDAENFVTFELGLKFARANLDAQLSAYYTDIDDLIIRTPTGRIIDGNSEITKRNSGGGKIEGVELQARYHLSDNWDVFGNVTWIDGVVDTFPTSDARLVSEPIDRLMPVTLWLGARWQPRQSDFWIEGLLGAADNQDKLSTRDQADTDRIPLGGTPGYSTWTIRGGWRVTDTLNVSASLENVLDKNYRIHGSGLNEPGRNIIVSVFWSP